MTDGGDDPQGGGTYLQGIGLVEILLKAITGIINRQLLSSISFNDFMHSFCVVRGVGNSTLEENLLQQITAMRETVFHSIFLNLRKSYNALDRDLCLDILAGYGAGARTIRILQTYWDRLQMAAKARVCYGSTFHSHHGLTQRVPVSPTILNVDVDTVICHRVTVLGYPQEGSRQEGLCTTIKALLAFFSMPMTSSSHLLRAPVFRGRSTT